MKNFIILFFVLVLVSCGRKGKDRSSGVGVTAALVNAESLIRLDFPDIDAGLACAADNSTFPEYGPMIGEKLFAVYFGSTPASPSTPQAFLTKLVAGNYMSTGGNNRLFTIP
jgi:hypothetical protein